MIATALNSHARAAPPPVPTQRGFLLPIGATLRSGTFGRVRRFSSGTFATPTARTGFVALPDGTSMSGRALDAALAEPEACPYPVFLLEPPHVPQVVRSLSVAALVAASIFGAYGAFVGVALPVLMQVDRGYYGGSQMTPQRFAAVVDFISGKEPLDHDPARRTEDRAFWGMLKEAKP